MEPNFSPGLKRPKFISTRDELNETRAEREKLEVELRELEAHIHSFEDSILKRSGPYFGRIAQGERAEGIIEDLTTQVTNSGPSAIDSESSSECGRDRKIRDSERLFSNSSVTAPANINKMKAGVSKVSTADKLPKKPE